MAWSELVASLTDKEIINLMSMLHHLWKVLWCTETRATVIHRNAVLLAVPWVSTLTSKPLRSTSIAPVTKKAIKIRNVAKEIVCLDDNICVATNADDFVSARNQARPEERAGNNSTLINFVIVPLPGDLKGIPPHEKHSAFDSIDSRALLLWEKRDRCATGSLRRGGISQAFFCRGFKSCDRPVSTHSAAEVEKYRVFILYCVIYHSPENMREIVHLQAGQCGNQIGAKVRKCTFGLLCCHRIVLANPQIACVAFTEFK